MQRHRLGFSLAVLASLLAATSAASAARFGGKVADGATASAASVTLVQVKPRVGGPMIGDDVTFTVSTSAIQPYVRLQCFQNGVMGYSETNGFFPSFPWDQIYRLGPTSVWPSGPATCRADLIVSGKRGSTTLASTSFNVSG
jgi:hypothetical protein